MPRTKPVPVRAQEFGLLCSREPFIRFPDGMLTKTCPCGRAHDGFTGMIVEIAEGSEAGHYVLYHPECLEGGEI